MEGICAALMMPATTSITSGSYGGERRAFALGIISSMASGAGTIWPIIGGFLTTYYTWRYAFGFELIMIIVILLFFRKNISISSNFKMERHRHFRSNTFIIRQICACCRNITS